MGLITKFPIARFHKATGPKSLFDRVYSKMANIHHLDLHGEHYNKRAVERNIPKFVLEKINQFDASEWALIMCEVRADKGKFINSTWEIVYNGQSYWITIGFNNLVMTVIKKNSSGKEEITTDGDLYEFVRRVNSELIASEQ